MVMGVCNGDAYDWPNTVDAVAGGVRLGRVSPSYLVFYMRRSLVFKRCQMYEDLIGVYRTRILYCPLFVSF